MNYSDRPRKTSMTGPVPQKKSRAIGDQQGNDGTIPVAVCDQGGRYVPMSGGGSVSNRSKTKMRC